jgi:hypothetical protein
MGDLHVAEVGSFFSNEDSFMFLSDQNLLEYDFIIVDTDTLISEIHGRSLKLVQKRIAELKEFIKRKNIPVVFMCSGEHSFACNGKGFTISEILELEADFESITGRKIEPNSESLFGDFLKKYSEDLEYLIGFSKHPGISIGNAKSRSLPIGFYTKDFVFMPTFQDEPNISDDEFLEDLYSLCKNVRKNEDVINIPEWTKNYYLPGEKDDKKKLIEIELAIAKLEEERTLSIQRLSNYFPLKQLWTSTGSTLENVVKKVFEELGFNIFPSSSGRDDITMKWNDQVIVVEIKGQTKSASEKNAAQLEKWVSTYYSDYGIMPKGLLIVNAFREIPLENRNGISFPDQMLPYSKSRQHCLLTTLQLCGLLLSSRENSDSKALLVKKLLDTEGRFEYFLDWREFLAVEKESTKKISKPVII